MTQTVYRQVANLIAVKHLMTQIGPRVPASMSASDAEDVLVDHFAGYDDEFERVAYVTFRRKIIGHVCILDLIQQDDTPVGELCDPIPHESVISESAPALEAAQRFTRNRKLSELHILGRSSIIGTLYYKDLFKPPFRLCLFAMALDLEERALGKLLRAPKKSWSALPEDRKDKAFTVWTKSHDLEVRIDGTEFDRDDLIDSRRSVAINLLTSTTLIDKGIVVSKRSLVPGMRKKVIGRFFETLNEVRNRCAHTGAREYNYGSGKYEPEGGPLIAREDFGDFMKTYSRIMSALR